MILFNLYGRPGAGKTTLAYYLTYRLKKAGIRAEFMGEAAREHHIYDATPGVVAPALLDNQILLAGQTFERVLRLQRHGFEAVVSDSPLIQGLLYCEGQFYYDSLKTIMRQMEQQFETYKIFIHPTLGQYDAESRVQRTEAEAESLTPTVVELAGGWETFWQQTTWDDSRALGDAVVLRAASSAGKYPPQ